VPKQLYNALDVRGTTCPLCYRENSILGERVDRKEVRCSGCYTRFIRRVGTAPIFDMFERVREPREVVRAQIATAEQHNAGARLADDYSCPTCGARGFQFECPSCRRAA
jgi:hypothetical protein